MSGTVHLIARAPGLLQNRGIVDRKSGDHLTEDQLRAVIARAIALDARGVTTSADELRSIASEIGISSEAVNAALLEHARGLEPRSSAASTRAAAAVVAAGIPLGIAAGALLGSASPAAAFGALGVVATGLVASGALVIAQGKSATLRSFQLRNLLLWGGLTIGGAVTVGLFGTGPLAIPGIVVGWGLRSWIASSILGSAAVIAVRRAAAPSDTGGGSATPAAAGSVRDRLVHAMKRIPAWLSRIVQRSFRATLPRRAFARLGVGTHV